MKSSIQLSCKHLENVGRMFRKLYKDEQLTDVTLYCKEGAIRAHKLILATSSPYFHKIFTENNRDHPILIMHGVSYQHLQLLIELIYKGIVEVGAEEVNALYELAGEFQLAGISGILRNEEDSGGDQSPESVKSNDSSSSHGRDTRYRGLKRVAVDYKDMDEAKTSAPFRKSIEPTHARDSEQETIKKHFEITGNGMEIKIENGHCHNDADTMDEESFYYSVKDEPEKLSAWAKKLRKFKCDLCPSSFKRSSHLTRHQLVHTGERPYACDQCDKAFSRHDKLKHHIRKTHEHDYESEYLEYSTPPSPPPFIITHVRTEPQPEPQPQTEPQILPQTSDGNPSPPKRPRGRPRKYPPNSFPVVKPLIKRGRGRPRLNPVAPPSVPPGRQEGNYDITNLPYGDLEYLTMPLHQHGDESVMIEPLVEIKTEIPEKDRETAGKAESDKEGERIEGEDEEEQANQASLRVLESKIAKIGECTISVANH